MSATVIVKNQTQNFETWKAGFDAGEPARRGSGGTHFSVARDPANPNVVVVISKWPSVEKARAFLQESAKRMAAAGAPEFRSSSHLTPAIWNRSGRDC